MLIISQNASNYGIPFPNETVYRINLAWVNSIEELEKLLQKHQDQQIFLDLPKWKLPEYKKFSKQRLSIDMDPKTREKLLDYCKPFNEEFYSLIGKKFDWDK